MIALFIVIANPVVVIDEIFSSPAELELSAEVTDDSDEVKMANFVTLIKSRQSGSELFKGMFTLANTGTTTGFNHEKSNQISYSGQRYFGWYNLEYTRT